MKKLLCILLSVIMSILLLLSSCAEKKEEQDDIFDEVGLDVNVDTGTLDIYCNTIAIEGIKVVYINNDKSVPYVNQGILCSLINKAQFTDIYTKSGSVKQVITNSVNGAYMKIDMENHTLFFDDYDKFFSVDNTDNPIRPATDGNAMEFFKINSSSYRAGESILIDLDEYNITTYQRKYNFYVPISVFFAVIPPLNSLVFNGSNIFTCNEGYPCYDDDGSLNEYGEFYKGNLQLTFDEKMRKDAYYNLCLCIDLNYGLKEEKGIVKADKFFEEDGVKNTIFDGEPSVEVFESAIDRIINILLDDRGHTGMGLGESSFFNKERFLSVSSTEEYTAREEAGEYIRSIRPKREPIELYDKNTAILTIDEFTYLQTENGKPTDNIDRTPNLIMSVNDNLNNNPEWADVENIIIDLSANQGGYLQAEIFLQSWIAGQAKESLLSVRTGGVGEYDIVADINADGVFDENDNISDKNVYVITSAFTYSAASVLVQNLKGADNVTLIGEKTAGGSCICEDFATLIGNSFRMSSGCRNLPPEAEGGIEPDILLARDEMVNAYEPNRLVSMKK